MKQIIRLLAFLLIPVLSLLSSPSLAVSDAVDDISDALFLPLIDVVRPLFVKLSFVIGGIFGATILLALVRVYYETKTIRLLKAIRFNLEQQNKRLGISYSSPRRNFYQWLLEFFEDRAHKKALKQLHRLKLSKVKLSKSKNENKHKA